MTNPWPLIGLVVILTIVVLWREGGRVCRIWQARLMARDRLEQEARARQEALTEALKNAVETGADGNKLLIGTMAACEVIAKATLELKDAVKAFHQTVSASDADRYPADNILRPASEEDAERAAMSFEAMLRGIPAQQAEAEAREATEKKIMISATSLGMGE